MDEAGISGNRALSLRRARSIQQRSTAVKKDRIIERILRIKSNMPVLNWAGDELLVQSAYAM